MFRQKRVAIGFIVGIVFVVFAGAITYVANSQYQQTAGQVAHYGSIQADLSNLSLSLVNAETGQRGYVITGNATYLAPYNSALLTINQTFSVLKILISSDSNLTAGYLLLQPLIKEKLAELNETIVLRNTQGFPAAQAVVNSGLGLLYMSEIRQVIGSMSSYVTAKMAQENSLASTQSSQRVNSAVFDVAVAIAGFGFAAYSANSNIAQERKARTQAELLQDILSHDVRNYNQISKISAEMLQEMHGDEKSEKLVSAILESIENSTALADNAKKLGRILAEKKVELYPVNLLNTLKDSLALVRKASENTGKEISEEWNLSTNTNSAVLADGLLDDVFVNIYSNCVKHSKDEAVAIRTSVKEGDKHFEISITDDAKGIPDEQKKHVFDRYLKTSTGRGLGMSIVRTLVVDRYGGKVYVSNAVKEDFTKGTTVDVWLRKARAAEKMSKESSEPFKPGVMKVAHFKCSLDF